MPRAVLLLVATVSLLAALPVGAADILVVRAGAPGAKISPTMWGVLIEDMNFTADGGLYAELVKNRGFEFPEPLMGWKGSSPDAVEILTESPFNAVNAHYLRIKAGGVSNEGFRGIGVRQAESYVFSAQVRAVTGRPALRVELVGGEGRTLADVRLAGFTGQWRKYTGTLRPTTTEPKARLDLRVEGAGAVDLDMVSLFPARTWRGRPGGLRADLVQMIADLKPGFIKFPGGFATEGRRLDSRYQWKMTIGDVAGRPLLISPWNQFSRRPMPDYYQSFGLGFFEYFQLCEDLGAEPLPVLNPGMSAMFAKEVVPLDQLTPYVQDALDLVEFASGPTTTAWGRRRAEMGHPKPFYLKMVMIGNEQTGPQYIERVERLAETLRTKYPGIKLVGTAGPDPDGQVFDFAVEKLRQLKVDILDQHSHRQTDWFFDAATRFDKADRSGPRIMMGEWASHSEPGLINPDNKNNLATALSEAAFMTGLERNADLVVMSAYVPMFAHADAWQWKPDMVWFDNLRVYGTPSYYVQKLFSENRGDVVLPLEQRADGVRPYASATRDTRTAEIIVKAVNATGEPAEVQIVLDGARVKSPVRAVVLAGPRLSDENSFEEPRKIYPAREPVAVAGSPFRYTFRPYSLTVLRLPAEPERKR
jgi:alpha-L-arabinofuranosidase